ncbi:RLK902 protein [Hibiscus syriacus]|uniref:RLK902 protein n=1 Tax=Hibiscus syriacus TaxID=106335 RepID=A0A6A2WZ85_HIBSY|nr:RLK902 protein [Hibiscus syriacus]
MKPSRYMISFSLLLWATLLVSVVDSNLASDRAAMVALRENVRGRLLHWNISSNPCNWTGVTCSSNRVVELRLPGMGLLGQLPVGMGNLTQLQTLSLRFNAISGSIPHDFAKLTALRNLYLQGNRFSGEIPAVLFTLKNLIRLNLANNNFSGPIPDGVSNLTRLFNGSIPRALSDKPQRAFLGNSLCGSPLVSCNGTESSGNKLSDGAIAGIVISCLLGVLLILILLICLCRRKSGEKMDETRERDAAPAQQPVAEIPGDNAAGESGSRSSGLSGVVKKESKSSGVKNLVFFEKASRVFDLEDLLRASAEVLGKGTFGTTYKATLEMGVVVAVKRLKDVTVSEKEFKEKMDVVGAMEHQNLVPLRAYYFSADEKLLVYDYMPMGSLSSPLHGNRGAGPRNLPWKRQIVKYPTYNILRRVSDFGLAQLAGPTSTPNRVDGYRAPEVTDAHKVSQKADVYSFGILLLELLTGKAPTHALLNEEGIDHPRWVQSIVLEDWTAKVFDLELLRYQNVEEDMVQLLQLAINCTVQYPDNRPSMAEVTNQIEELCRSNLDKETR